MSHIKEQIEAIKNGDYVICSCEGAAEKAIIDLLLDNGCLIFRRENLIDCEATRLRSAKKIEKNFLNRAFKKTVHIIRIIDSKKENFKLSKVYCGRPKEIDEDCIPVHTHPEIEILIIISADKYEDFQRCKSNELPSEYCNRVISDEIDVKSKKYIDEYFKDINFLLSAIKNYKKKVYMEKGEWCLYDLLNDKTKQSILN